MSDRESRGHEPLAPGETKHDGYDELDDQFDRDDLRRRREHHTFRLSASLTQRERDERWPIG